MIAKILDKTGSFNAVNYNTKKINNGAGELMAIQNMPTLSMNNIPNPQIVKDYLKAYSNTNKRVKKPQFHATISAKGQEYNKYQLTEIAKMYMEKMGYGNQPYIIVSHNDTENNHIHIVSTRVTKNGEKISDKFEKIRSQKAMQEIMNEKYNISEARNLEKLLSYKFNDLSPLKTLLERNSFKIGQKDNSYNIYKGGVLIQSLEKLPLSEISKKEKMQLKAKLISYSQTYDPTLKFQKDKGIWKSQATEKLKNSLGIDIVFHHKGDKQPFGYTIIDNVNQTVIKGSEVLKLSELITPQILSEKKEVTTDPQFKPEDLIIPDIAPENIIEKEDRAENVILSEDLMLDLSEIDERDFENDFGLHESDEKKQTDDISSVMAHFLDSMDGEDDEDQEEEENQNNKNAVRRKRKR
jgi:hypothetical protein